MQKFGNENEKGKERTAQQSYDQNDDDGDEDDETEIVHRIPLFDVMDVVVDMVDKETLTHSSVSAAAVKNKL